MRRYVERTVHRAKRRTIRKRHDRRDPRSRIRTSVAVVVTTAFAVDVLAPALELPRSVASRDPVLADIAAFRPARVDFEVLAPFGLRHARVGLSGPDVAALGTCLALRPRPLECVAVGLAAPSLALIAPTSHLVTLRLRLAASTSRLATAVSARAGPLSS